MAVSTLKLKKSQHYPLEEWQEIIASWKTSGLSKRQYCQQHKITQSAFSRWFKKIETGKSLESLPHKNLSNKFIPVHLVEETQIPNADKPRLDIVMANGHHLWIQGSVEQLTSFIKPLLIS